MTGFAVSIADANSCCTATGSAASAICASRGRRVRRPGRVPSPASGPASAAVRCLNCSVVAAPSAKHSVQARPGLAKGGQMKRSGQDARRPPEASGFDGQVALGLVGLGVVGHVLRSRRFYEKVAVTAIVLGALRGIGQDNQASTMARLQAWDKRQIQRMERKARRQGRAVTGSRGWRVRGRREAWPRQVSELTIMGLAAAGRSSRRSLLSRRADGGLAGYPAGGRRR